MSAASSASGRRFNYSRLAILTVLALLGPLLIIAAAQQGAVVPNSGFVIFGRVFLPDNKPAVRVRVYVDSVRGIKRDSLTDDQGQYEIRGLPGGRYRATAVNAEDSKMYTDPVEADSTRAYANRLQIDIYFRYPLHERKEASSGTVSAVESRQEIPKPARKAYDQGIKMQKENKAVEAMAAFNQAIELYPEYFQAFAERGNLLMQHNRLTEALVEFGRALQINGQYSPALRGAGYCNIQQKKHEEAIGQLEKSLRYEPKIALTHMLLGYAHLALNRYDGAKTELQEALKLGGDNIARARVYLAEVYVHEQKFKEAADEIRAYLKVKPDAADAASFRNMETDWRARASTAKEKP